MLRSAGRTVQRIRHSTRAVKLTYRDYLRFPEDGRRHELINGSCPRRLSPDISSPQAADHPGHFEAHPVGEVFVSPFEIVLSDFDILVPDLLVVLEDQSEIVTERHVRGAPAIVVEVLSPGTKRRDLGIKRRIYDRRGVREYWVVDPEQKAVTLYRRSPDGDLTPAMESAERTDGTLTTPLLPSFSLRLDRLFSASQ